MDSTNLETIKRFFFCKVKDDFGDDDLIDYVMSQKNGPVYFSVFFLLCLKSIKNQGRLVYKLNNREVPYDAEKIRRELKHFDIDTIMVALELLKGVGLIRVMPNNTMFIPMIPAMIGSEASNSNAQRQKRFRERQKEKQLALIAQDNVTESVINSNDESVTKNNDSIENIAQRIEHRDYSIETISYNSENIISPSIQENYFQKFLSLFPKKTEPTKIHFVEKAWMDNAAGRETEILDSLQENIEKNPSWKEENGRFIPSAEKWLVTHGWEKEIRPPAADDQENDPNRFLNSAYRGVINS